MILSTKAILLHYVVRGGGGSPQLKGTVSAISWRPSMQRWQCKIHNGTLKINFLSISTAGKHKGIIKIKHIKP